MRYQIKTVKREYDTRYTLVDTHTESCQPEGEGFQIVRGPTYSVGVPSYMTAIQRDMNAKAGENFASN